MDTDRVEFNDNSSEFITETSTDRECFDNESFTYRQEHEYRMLSKKMEEETKQQIERTKQSMEGTRQKKYDIELYKLKMDFLQNFNMMDPSSVSRR